MNKIINHNLNFQELIKIYLESKSKYFFVVNKENKLIGAISQSDIIIALLNSVGNSTKILNIMNPNPLFIRVRDLENFRNKELISFINEGITEFPVLDDEDRIIDIKSIKDKL